MDFLNRVLSLDTIAGGLAILSLAVTLGLALGSVQIRGLKLGISGVLFSSLLFGQVGLTVDPNVLSFLRDFSLILFAYTIGLQVGPGFVDSLKAEGLRLNLLSIAVLVIGAGMTFVLVLVTHIASAYSPGLYAGAFTTTPGLAAGQEVLRHSSAVAMQAVRAAGLAYTVTYPVGMIGPACVIALFRAMFRVNVAEERAAHKAAAEKRRPTSIIVDVEVMHATITDIAVSDLIVRHRLSVVFSRLLRDGKMTVPTADTRLAVGDVVRAVGLPAAVEESIRLLGKRSEIDLGGLASSIERIELLVTRTSVLGKTLRELDLIRRHGVTLPRVTRSGVDLIPNGSLVLRFGDAVTAVGPADALAAVERELGNCRDAINRPQLGPIFLGIVLGVLVGSVPIMIPGIKGGIKLGLAAGPMLVAIVLSRTGNIRGVIWYMPTAASQLFRDFGLALFLACVGLQQGDHYVQKLMSGTGLVLVALGIVLTVLPLLIVGIVARKHFKMNYLTLAGWAAGAMTSSPALMYASDVTQSDAPALAYAAVAPLALIVPILCCQALAAL